VYIAALLGKCALQLLHDGTFHANVGVPPVARHPAIAAPLPTGAGSAGQSKTAVDNQDAAMVAIVRAVHTERP
jgi:hypothetical protein